MNKISVLSVLFTLIFVGCKNINVPSSEVAESEIGDTLSDVSLNSDDGYSEVYDEALSDSPFNAGWWQKKYFTDEFDEEDYNHPFLEQAWDGLRNNHFDCRLIIRVSDYYGFQFGVFEDYGMANLSGLTLTGMFNGKKFQIPFDDETDGVVTINNQNVIAELLQIFDSEGTLKLSFYRVDAFDSPQNHVFTIHTPTHLREALPNIGVDLSSVSEDEEPEVIMDMDRFLEKLQE